MSTTPDKPEFIPTNVAALMYYHFFGDDHPFPGTGIFASIGGQPCYEAGCAIGCLIPPSFRESLDHPVSPDPDDDGDNEGDSYETIDTLYENYRDLLTKALSDTFRVSDSLSLDTICFMRACQACHDRYATKVPSDPSPEDLADFKSDLLTVFRCWGILPLHLENKIQRFRQNNRIPSFIGKTHKELFS